MHKFNPLPSLQPHMRPLAATLLGAAATAMPLHALLPRCTAWVGALLEAAKRDKREGDGVLHAAACEALAKIFTRQVVRSTQILIPSWSFALLQDMLHALCACLPDENAADMTFCRNTLSHLHVLLAGWASVSMFPVYAKKAQALLDVVSNHSSSLPSLLQPPLPTSPYSSSFQRSMHCLQSWLYCPPA